MDNKIRYEIRDEQHNSFKHKHYYDSEEEVMIILARWFNMRVTNTRKFSRYFNVYVVTDNGGQGELWHQQFDKWNR